MRKIIEELKTNENNINKIVISDTKSNVKKIIIRPITLKGSIKWQMEKYIGAQVFHSNVDFDKIFELNLDDYRQIVIDKVGESVQFSRSSKGYKAKRTMNTQVKSIGSNNREKKYLINEGDDVPALVDLGVFTSEGKIVSSMYNKFKQINKFIEIIDHAYKDYKGEEITILDFGCGKSYLTFLIYYYFVKIKRVKAKIIGYDLKADVVDNCNSIAKKYNYEGLEFVLSDVKKDKLYSGKIDMVISLHACDTATDYALDFAIQNNVRNIFSVPCCQHEINSTIATGGDLDIFMQDGLIKERFSALLTDAIRVELLRCRGYSVDVIEFVDFEHSPKNLMIRATLNSRHRPSQHLYKLQEKYSFNQKLLDLLK